MKNLLSPFKPFFCSIQVNVVPEYGKFDYDGDVFQGVTYN